MKIFKNRQSAGKLLANRLKQYKGSNVLVLAIPRGGVVVAREVAEGLDLPLDIIVTRKIGAPNQKELALGAIDRDGEVVWDEILLKDLGIKVEDLKNKIEQEKEEIKRREKVYRQGRMPLNLENKIVILIDDGIATGATTLSAVRYLKRSGIKEVILAVPVAPEEAISKLKDEVDEIVVLEKPTQFNAVGQFYQEFLPVSDDMVIQYLKDE